MNYLLIDKDTQEKINALMAYAENNIVKFENLFQAPIGDNKNHVIFICKYRCVYSIEENKGNTICKHLSVSSYPFKGNLPHIEAVRFIMSAFGFGDDVTNADRVWIEEVGGIKTAINVLKVISGNRERIPVSDASNR